jgi:methanogenic corrinoid protein MtbC1
MNSQQAREQLLEAIRHSDRVQANAVLDAWAAEEGYENTLREVLEPVMEKVGDMWVGEGQVTFAQVYVSAKITEDLLLKAAQGREGQAPQQGARIVIGNIEDDFHSLGRKLLGIFLEASGWEVHDLGNDVPAERFVEEAVRLDAPLIGVSAMMYNTAQNILKVREELDRRNLSDRIRLAAGGAVFNIRPELADSVGADGTARNALQACELMKRLLDGIPAAGEGVRT